MSLIVTVIYAPVGQIGLLFAIPSDRTNDGSGGRKGRRGMQPLHRSRTRETSPVLKVSRKGLEHTANRHEKGDNLHRLNKIPVRDPTLSRNINPLNVIAVSSTLKIEETTLRRNIMASTTLSK